MPNPISTGRATGGERPKRYRFRILQDGMVVAEGSGTDTDAVKREATHYAAMYLQDGPVKIRLYGFSRATESAGDG